MIPRPTDRGLACQSGLTLVELMIAITIGLMVIAALTVTFVNSSRARDEVERANQQVENGRYAMQVLSDDLRLAGYMAEFNVAGAGLLTPAIKPDPCFGSPATPTLASLQNAMPLHVQGYDNGAALTCLSGETLVPNTDIIVVRRVGTCVLGPVAAPNCASVGWYFQVSLCNSSTELASVTPQGADQYNLDTNPANLTSTTGRTGRHKKDCTTFANWRQYITRIYFVAGNDQPGDGIPTLKRAELGATGFTIVPIAEGIENLQLEYGIDTNNDGVPDAMNANPDTWNACAGAACVANWLNVMSVKINVLARGTSASGGYTDDKTYSLGLNANGSANNVTLGGPYKRHVFQAEVRLNNPAGRRE